MSGQITLCNKCGDPATGQTCVGPRCDTCGCDNATEHPELCIADQTRPLPLLQEGQCPAYREYSLNCGLMVNHEGSHTNEGPFARQVCGQCGDGYLIGGPRCPSGQVDYTCTNTQCDFVSSPETWPLA